MATDELIAEAQAAMTPAAKAELNRKQAQGKRTDFAGGVVHGIFTILSGMGV